MATEEEIDFTKLAIEDRVTHKNWKGRVSGYEALVKVFNDADDEKAPEFAKYASCLKKSAIDSNVMALEKGLSAIQAFLNNAAMGTSAKIASDVISGCLTKAILQTRPKIKELTTDIILMYVELEKHEQVQEELLKGSENKSPKVAAGCISLLRDALHQFGFKIIKISPLIKALPGLLEHKDKNIREEARQLSVEIYRWIKDAMKPQIASLKPVILNELEEEFVKVKDEKPSPSRFLRSEQVRVQQAGTGDEDAEADDNSNTGATETNEELDPFEMFEPVEILSKLPGDFYEKCEAKKWQERKEALEALLALLTPNPKLATGDYGELVKILKKIVSKDANVVVVGIGAKCLAELASKLRKNFGPYAHSCITTYIDKFKEKKQSVVVPLREAVDAALLAANIENVLEDIVAACDNKNPAIKSEVVQFISRFASNSPLDFLTNKKNLKALVNALTKTLNDNDGGVRDQSAEALGILMKAVGEKTIMPLLSEVDAIKITKIKECFEKATVKYSLPVARPAAPAPASKMAEKKTAGTETKRPVARPKTVGTMPRKTATTSSNKNLTETESSVTQTRPGTAGSVAAKSKVVSKSASVKSRLAKSAVPSASSSRTDPDAVGPLLQKNNLKEQRVIDEKQLKILKWNFTAPREEFFSELKELMQLAGFNPMLITNCFHSDFKYHLKAIEAISAFISVEDNASATLANSDLILKWAALRFFDTNPSVILKLLELLNKLFFVYFKAEQLVSETEAHNFIPYLILKTGDPKDVLRTKVHEIITRLKDVYSPIKLFTLIMNGVSSKNARQRAMCIEELGNLIKVYGMGVCQPSPIQACKEISRQIGDKDSGVRNAALNCILEIYQFEDERVYKLIGNLNDKDMEMLEKRIKRAGRRCSGTTKPLEPTILVKELPTPTPVVPAPATLIAKPELKEQPSSPTGSNSNLRRPMSFKPKTPSTVTKQHSNGSLNGFGHVNSDTMPEENVSGEIIQNETRRKVIAQRTRTPSPVDDHSPTPLVSTIVKSKRPQSLSFSPEELESKLESKLQSKLAQQRSFPTLRRPQAVQQMSAELADELLTMPEVELPNRLFMNPSPRKSFGGGSATEKADRVICTYISQLSQTDIEQALLAAQQISYALSSSERSREHFANKVDQLIMLCSIQYKLVINKHLTDPALNENCVRELLTAITQLLIALFSDEQLCKKASLEMLKELISLIINLIVDNRVADFVNDNTTMRQVNQLVRTILRNADATAMLSALIRILRECFAGNVGSTDMAKFTLLTTKCMWKLIEQYNSAMMRQLRLEHILLDMHRFFEEFPVSACKDATKIHQLRTLRGLLAMFVKDKRGHIFKYMEQIPQNSELYRLVHKALDEQKAKQAEQEAPIEEPLDDADNDLLEQLLRKVRREATVKNILELLDFCACRPNFHLEQHLRDHYPESFANKLIEQMHAVKSTGNLGTSSSNGNGSTHVPSRTGEVKNDTRSTFGFNRQTGIPRPKLTRLPSDELKHSHFTEWYSNTMRSLGKEPGELGKNANESTSRSDQYQSPRSVSERFISRKENFLASARK